MTGFLCSLGGVCLTSLQTIRYVIKWNFQECCCRFGISHLPMFLVTTVIHRPRTEVYNWPIFDGYMFSKTVFVVYGCQQKFVMSINKNSLLGTAVGLKATLQLIKLSFY